MAKEVARVKPVTEDCVSRNETCEPNKYKSVFILSISPAGVSFDKGGLSLYKYKKNALMWDVFIHLLEVRALCALF